MDSLGIADGLNRFRYCKSNPISNMDIRGLQTEGTVGTTRGIAESKRKAANEISRILGEMAHHPEQYPNVTEAAKAAMRAEMNSLNREAGKLEQHADVETEKHMFGLKMTALVGITVVLAPAIPVLAAGAEALSVAAYEGTIGPAISALQAGWQAKAAGITGALYAAGPHLQRFANNVINFFDEGNVMSSSVAVMEHAASSVLGKFKVTQFGIRTVSTTVEELTGRNLHMSNMAPGNRPLAGLSKQELHELYLAEIKKFGEQNVKLLKDKIIHRHHLLPQEFREEFEALDLDIEKFTVWLEESVHLNHYHGGAENGGLWNKAWKDFFEKNKENRNLSASDVLKKLDELNKQWETLKHKL